MSGRPRIVVLVSGNGSNLQAILDACSSGQLGADVVGVVSNNPDAYALRRATDAEVPAVALVAHKGEDRRDYDARLADIVSGLGADWVVLAGWLRILTVPFLGWFPGRVINLHPSLPGDLVGMHAIERAYDEGLAGTRTSTGVMVHLVPDEGVDNGPVLATAVVALIPGEPLADFETRMHAVEHQLLVRTLAAVTVRAGVPT
jgi:phosphoribosylglycinamide formyltransferase 1